MKKILFLIVFLAFGCSNESDDLRGLDGAGDVEMLSEIKINSDKIYSDLMDLKYRYESVVTENVEYKIEIEKKLILIDTLLKKTVKYQNKYIELKVINDEVNSISELNEALVQKITEENDYMKLKEDSILNALNDETNAKKKVIRENKRLKRVINKANKLIPTKVTITPYSISRNFFTSKYKKAITHQAVKVKTIIVSFAIPHSNIVTKGHYDFKVIIYNTPKTKLLQQNISINYVGDEVPVTIKFDDANIIYEKGPHKVVIKSGKHILYESVLELK